MSAHSNPQVAPRALGGDGRFGSALLQDSIAQGKPLMARFEALRQRNISAVANQQQEINRLDAGTSSAVAQKFGRARGFAGNLEQAVRRAKARGGITNRGEAAIKNQALKDRVSIARQNIGRRGQNIQAFANSTRIQQGLDTSLIQSRDRVNSSISGAVGSIAGGLTSAIKGGLFKADGINAVNTDLGTASADFQIDTPRSFDFADPQTNPMGSPGTVFG